MLGYCRPPNLAYCLFKPFLINVFEEVLLQFEVFFRCKFFVRRASLTKQLGRERNIFSLIVFPSGLGEPKLNNLFSLDKKIFFGPYSSLLASLSSLWCLFTLLFTSLICTNQIDRRKIAYSESQIRFRITWPYRSPTAPQEETKFISEDVYYSIHKISVLYLNGHATAQEKRRWRFQKKSKTQIRSQKSSGLDYFAT